MKPNPNSKFNNSAYQNKQAWISYFDRLSELAMVMFEWKNLPKEIDERFLELVLFTDGKAVFFWSEEMKEYLCLKCTIGGNYNVYHIPTNRTAYASNGFRQELDEKNSVIIYNNYMRTNSAFDIEMYARRLWDIDRSIDINAHAQKTPIIIQCKENQRLTLKNLYQKYDGNEPFIFADKNLDLDGIKVLNTGAPYVADKLYNLRNLIWNEALTFLGINNINVSKKERMITDEVMRNQGGIIASRYGRLEARRKACKQINDMFGLNIEVDYRQDYREADDEYMLGGATEDGTPTPMVADLRTRSVWH